MTGPIDITNLLTSGKIGRLCGRGHRIVCYVARKMGVEPVIRVGNLDLYTSEQAEQLAAGVRTLPLSRKMVLQNSK